ncbi:MAG: alpha/beta hydrolase [Flavobacteriaceae bacterium]|nr:alpha/beta hydrolase [Flavobacteriaceae bacterium]
MKVVLIILKIVFSLFIFLFALATFLGRSYVQTISLLALIFFIFYWPSVKNRQFISRIARLLTIAILFLLQFTFFKGEPKTSIYISQSAEDNIYSIYAEKRLDWPADTEDLFISTQYGKVHVLASGHDSLPPVLLLHAASMGAHSWAENLSPLLGKYRIYAVDNIGEGNLSVLDDPMKYPNTPKAIADLYADIASQLDIEHAPVIGASNGGYIAQVFTCYYPQKVDALILLGPMGITSLSNKSIFMMSVASMYPIQFIRDGVQKWALGTDTYVNEKYGNWFNAILKGTIPSIAMPVPLTNEQKIEMKMPVLLFLGTSDPIVGPDATAKKIAEVYPNIKIEILESGHLIGVERRNVVNKSIAAFLESGF